MAVMSATRSTRLAVGSFRANPLYVAAGLLPDRALLIMRVPRFLRGVRMREPIEVRFTDVEQVWLHRRSATVVRSAASRLPPLTVSAWLGRAIAEGAGRPTAPAQAKRCRQLVKGWRRPAG